MNSYGKSVASYKTAFISGQIFPKKPSCAHFQHFCSALKTSVLIARKYLDR